jgi:hypothetical protein
MLKKDCFHCIKIRLTKNRCYETKQIIEDIHNHCCDKFEEDWWMAQHENEFDDEKINNKLIIL